MAINKIVFDKNTLIDLTQDTVTPETLAEGVTAHGANGEPIVGTMRSAEDLDAVLAEQEELIATLQTTLQRKAEGSGDGVVDPVIQPLEVTENGTYVVPDGVDGYSPVVVDVPIPDGYIIPSGKLEVTENGEHDVTKYASVDVNVPIPDGYIVPSGELEIADNGAYNVTEYASVKVDVPIPDGYIQPNGTKNITSNGTHDAKAYESVSVNVPIPEGYIVPSGNLEITDNGPYDVTEYRSVSVNVEASGTEVETYTGTIVGETGSAGDTMVHYTDGTFTLRSEIVPITDWATPAEPLSITVAANTVVFVDCDRFLATNGSGFENIGNLFSKNIGLRPIANNFNISLS